MGSSARPSAAPPPLAEPAAQEVFEAGVGLGSVLARGALADARRRGLPVVPICPFIAAYIRRHADEYADIRHVSIKARVLADA